MPTQSQLSHISEYIVSPNDGASLENPSVIEIPLTSEPSYGTIQRRKMHAAGKKVLRKSIPTTSEKDSSQRQLIQSTNSKEDSLQRKRKKFITKISRSSTGRIAASVERSQSIEKPSSDHSTERMRGNTIPNIEDSTEAYTQVPNRVDVHARPSTLHSEGR